MTLQMHLCDNCYANQFCLEKFKAECLGYLDKDELNSWGQEPDEWGNPVITQEN